MKQLKLFSNNHFTNIAIGDNVIIYDSTAKDLNNKQFWVLNMRGIVTDIIDNSYLIKIKSFNRQDGVFKGVPIIKKIPGKVIICKNILVY